MSIVKRAKLVELETLSKYVDVILAYIYKIMPRAFKKYFGGEDEDSDSC
jgi:hypothetical protein